MQIISLGKNPSILYVCLQIPNKSETLILVTDCETNNCMM